MMAALLVIIARSDEQTCERVFRLLRWVVNRPEPPSTQAAVPARLSLPDVEDFAACHVVVDDPVCQSIQLVALPHEFAANRIHLGVGHPMVERYLLNTIQRAG